MIKRDIVIGIALLVAAAIVPFIWPERYVLLELTLFCIWATVVTRVEFWYSVSPASFP